MGIQLSLPFYAILAFCTFTLVIQGVMLGDEFAANLPTAPDFSGGFFSDVGAIAGFALDVIEFIVRFLAFDMFPGMPWWVQFPLAVLCNGVFLIALLAIVIRLAEGIGALLPFT